MDTGEPSFPKSLRLRFPDSFSFFLPSNYEIKSVFAAYLTSLCLYGPLAAFILIWYINPPVLPVKVNSGATVQLFNIAGSGKYDNFNVAKGYAGNPIPIVTKMPTVLFPNGGDASSVSDLIPAGSSDICLAEKAGAILTSLTETALVTESTNSELPPVGIAFGGSQGSPMLVDQGFVVMMAALGATLLAGIGCMSMYYLKDLSTQNDSDKMRGLLSSFAFLERLVVGSFATYAVLVAAGFSNTFDIDLFMIWFFINQLVRVISFITCNSVVLSGRINEPSTLQNSVSVDLISKVFYLLYTVSSFIFLLSIVFQSHNWFIGVPDMAPFAPVYTEGIGGMSRAFAFSYTTGTWLLDAWFGWAMVRMIDTLITNRTTLHYSAAINYKAFYWRTVLETVVNALAFLFFFAHVGGTRFLKCSLD